MEPYDPAHNLCSIDATYLHFPGINKSVRGRASCSCAAYLPQSIRMAYPLASLNQELTPTHLIDQIDRTWEKKMSHLVL